MHRITRSALLALLLSPALATAQDHAHHGHGHAGHGNTATDDANAAARKEFAQLDRNGDGHVGHDELPADHPLHAHFGHIDRNGDHRLDLEEFLAGAAMR